MGWTVRSSVGWSCALWSDVCKLLTPAGVGSPHWVASVRKNNLWTSQLSSDAVTPIYKPLSTCSQLWQVLPVSLFQAYTISPGLFFCLSISQAFALPLNRRKKPNPTSLPRKTSKTQKGKKSRNCHDKSFGYVRVVHFLVYPV